MICYIPSYGLNMYFGQIGHFYARDVKVVWDVKVVLRLV